MFEDIESYHNVKALILNLRHIGQIKLGIAIGPQEVGCDIGCGDSLNQGSENGFRSKMQDPFATNDPVRVKLVGVLQGRKRKPVPNAGVAGGAICPLVPVAR